jgi:hypothetical protein
MSNPFVQKLPKPPVEDPRPAIELFRQFAEALQQYPGRDTDVEVSVSVHPEGGIDKVAEVRMSVYVPKTDYVNLILFSRCQGPDGFPCTIDPYFASSSFPNRILCRDKAELQGHLEQLLQSPEILNLLEYMQRHARKIKP